MAKSNCYYMIAGFGPFVTLAGARRIRTALGLDGSNAKIDKVCRRKGGPPTVRSGLEGARRRRRKRGRCVRYSKGKRRCLKRAA